MRPLTIAVWVVLIGGWEAAAHAFGRTSAGGEETIPSIESIVRAFPVLSNYWTGGLGVPTPVQGGEASVIGGALGLAYNSAVTLVRLVLGLLIGIAAGIGLAVAISWSKYLRQMMAFPAHFARMLPVLAMVPLFTLWFGNRDRGAVIFIAFSAFVVLFVHHPERDQQRTLVLRPMGAKPGRPVGPRLPDGDPSGDAAAAAGRHSPRARLRMERRDRVGAAGAKPWARTNRRGCELLRQDQFDGTRRRRDRGVRGAVVSARSTTAYVRHEVGRVSHQRGSILASRLSCRTRVEVGEEFDQLVVAWPPTCEHVLYT